MAHAYVCDACHEFYIRGSQVSVSIKQSSSYYDLCPACTRDICEILGIDDAQFSEWYENARKAHPITESDGHAHK